MPQAFSQIIENGRLAMRLMNDPRVPTWVRYGIPTIVVLYVILPIDFIPDFIPGVGQMDDLTVVLFGMSLMSRLAPSAVVDEHKRALGYDVPPASKPASSQPGKGETSQTSQGSYWSTPPGRKGQQTTRINGHNGAIDGDYKVVNQDQADQ